jgi:hypothetical protein
MHAAACPNQRLNTKSLLIKLEETCVILSECFWVAYDESFCKKNYTFLNLFVLNGWTVKSGGG